jgi:hypothetical protein
MSFGWFGAGVAMLLVGLAAGGASLVLSLIGFALSMYLSIGMFVAAIRGPRKSRA